MEGEQLTRALSLLRLDALSEPERRELAALAPAAIARQLTRQTQASEAIERARTQTKTNNHAPSVSASATCSRPHTPPHDRVRGVRVGNSVRGG
jgi:hypothetical protein